MSQMLIPNPLWTNHYNESGRGLSPRLWSRIASHGAAPDGSQGYFISDDFLTVGQSVAVASNVGCYVSAAGQYKTYEDTSSTVTQPATEVGGVLQLLTTTSDNSETSICQGGAGTGAATSVLGKLSYDTAADRKMVIFESRFKVSSVADDVAAIFVGLMEEDGAVHNALVDNTGVVIDNDFIGFGTVHTNGGTAGTNAILTFKYKKDGQTQVIPIASLGTLAADTYVKAGFCYDPQATDSKKISIFYNNAEQTTYVTATMMDAATFPDGEEMGFFAAVKNGNTTGANLKLDWWAFYQEG